MRVNAPTVTVALLLCATAPAIFAAEYIGAGGLLPAGTELGDYAPDRPREVFRSETRGGRQTYLGVLGDIAFNSPSILGPVARQAGISCNTCHVNGASNPRLFIPGLARRPGTLARDHGRARSVYRGYRLRTQPAARRRWRPAGAGYGFRAAWRSVVP